MMVPTQNTCAADEAMVLCIIRDMTNTLSSSRFNVNLPASRSGRELIEEVGKLLAYEPDSFTLTYEKPEGDQFIEVNMDAFLEQQLSAVCAHVGNSKRNNFTVMDKDGVSPIKVESKDSGVDAGNVGATASQTVSSDNIYSSTYSSSSWSNMYSSGYSYSSALMKSDTGYVGLVNQAMTCYLNSLLQTLYMTPEFRNALYRWSLDGGHAEKNIPYQLQRLFLQLQTSNRRATETTDITKSFGWDSSEAWQQHDVQELMRVMFDALEKKWKNTDQANLINKLYQGKMKDYVKCLECEHESARTDSYLDVPLTIRAFGSDRVHNSVNESLQAFVQPELLDGDNQYFCDKCNKKCDAHKGLKFISFPYLLTLQLKRFDFDYTTMHRIKLNDKMTFPEILNLNHLIDDLNPTSGNVEGKGGGGEGELVGEGSCDDNVDVSPSAASCPTPETNLTSCDCDEGIDEGADDGCSASGGNSNTGISSSEAAANERNTMNSAVKGPFEYELYSIMIHSGSAAGGHYYAYIKSFKDGQWYSFNDQHVSTITYDDIRKTYGGSTGTRGYYSATYASSTNAYMLVYRQIDKEHNEAALTEEEFPAKLQDVLYKLQNREEEEKKQQEIEKSTCKIKLFCFHPVQKKQLESKLEVHKDATLMSATEIAWKQFELENNVSLDCVRLVKYDEFNDYTERSFDGEEQETMEKVLDGVKNSYMFDLLLEVKRPDQKFQEYRQGGITVKVLVCDIEQETIDPPVTVRAYQNLTVEEFKLMVAQDLRLQYAEVKNLRFVLERYYNELKLLTLPHKTLKSEGFFKTNKVFVECSGLEDDDRVVFSESKFGLLLDRYEHTIRIHVSLPPFSEKVPIRSRPKNTEQQLGINGQSNNDSDEGIGDDESECDSITNNSQANIQNTNGGTFVVSSTSVSTLPLQEEISLENSVISSSAIISDRLQQQKLSGSDVSLNIAIGAQAPAPPIPPPPPPLPPHFQHHAHNSSSSSVGNEQSAAEDSESTVTSSLDSNSTVTSCSTVTPSEPVNAMDDDENEHALNSDLLSSKVTSVASSQAAAAAAAARILNSESGDYQATTSYASNESHSKSISDQLNSSMSEKDSATAGASENWDAELSVENHIPPEVDSDDEYRKYCRASLNIDAQTKERSLTVFVDKRITLKSFKKELEKYVGATTDYFKIYKVYSNNQEFECTKPTETLTGYGDDCKLIVKLGRALKRGECRVKIYQLLLNEPEHSKSLTEIIVAKGMTVAKVRKMIINELKEECDIEIPYNRCRIRKKSWKSPSTIYLDDQIFDHDIPLLSTLELFVEKLMGPERMDSQTQMSIYCRRWRPSKHEVGPFEEVIVSDTRKQCLQESLSEISGIPAERVEFARSKGTFPCEVSVLEVNNDLDWNPTVTIITAWPMSISDDGCIIYYRDSEEELEKLSDERKKELQQKENIRLARYNTYSSKYNIYSRKEKALKIYTDDSPVKDNSSVNAAASGSSHLSPSKLSDNKTGNVKSSLF